MHRGGLGIGGNEQIVSCANFDINLAGFIGEPPAKAFRHAFRLACLPVQPFHLGNRIRRPPGSFAQTGIIIQIKCLTESL